MTTASNLRHTLGQLILAIILVCSMATLAVAQTNVTPQEKARQQPPTSVTNDQGGKQQGWVWWDDSMARELNVTPERLRELRAVDDRYRQEYNGLGTAPWNAPNYKALTERRNTEIQRLLTPEQYQQYLNRTMRDQGNAVPNDRDR
jgi:hypothetical protein